MVRSSSQVGESPAVNVTHLNAILPNRLITQQADGSDTPKTFLAATSIANCTKSQTVPLMAYHANSGRRVPQQSTASWHEFPVEITFSTPDISGDWEQGG